MEKGYFSKYQSIGGCSELKHSAEGSVYGRPIGSKSGLRRVGLLKRDDGSVVRSGHDLRPTRIIRYFAPTEQLGIEVGKPTRLRAVNHEHVKSSDYRTTVRRLSRPGKASGTGGSLFSTNGRFGLSPPVAERATPKRWHRNRHRIIAPDFRQLARPVAITAPLRYGIGIGIGMGL